MVRSRYTFIQWIVVLFGIFFISIPFVFKLNVPTSSVEFYLASTLIISMGILMTLIYFKKSPVIILSEEFINIKYPFGSKKYNWESVKDVFLSKKENFLGLYLEATKITFGGGKKLILWEDMYTNLAQIRNFISRHVPSKIRDPIHVISKKNILAVTGTRYFGNVYTSFNTLLIVGMALLFFILLRPLKLGPLLLIPIGFLLFVFLMTGKQMNYFLIDGGYLFIKNHYFPWKNKRISLNDIEEVVIEAPYKKSTGLRIRSTDFNSIIYGAGTLSSRNWNELLNDLKIIGIPVRDER